MLRYHLSSPISAIENSAKGLQIIQLQAGAVLITAHTDKNSGFVEAVCQGRNLTVFIEDLKNRANLVVDKAG